MILPQLQCIIAANIDLSDIAILSIWSNDTKYEVRMATFHNSFGRISLCSSFDWIGVVQVGKHAREKNKKHLAVTGVGVNYMCIS